jgi:hypothetical protein
MRILYHPSHSKNLIFSVFRCGMHASAGGRIMAGTNLEDSSVSIAQFTAPALALCMLTASALAQAAVPAPPSTTFPGPQTIHPGDLWPDDQGRHVQAHGGGIIKLADNITKPGGDAGAFTYYWFGEERAQNLPRNQRAVACYSSKDLAHWTFLKDAFTALGTEIPILERPKVFYNAKTQKFVMYVHYDDAGYRLAEVGVATSDKVDGPYTLLKHFRPLNHESRDIGQFIDDDGTPYLIFEDRPNGWHIATLSDDYLSVEKDVCLIKMPMEGGALVHYDGLYYAIGSHLTGWNANPNLYATAKSLEGPWSAFKDIAPPQTNTYGSQSTMMVKVVGAKATTVIFMGDIWRPAAQWDSRYLWMPLEIGDGKLRLPEPREWTLDVGSGEAVINQSAPAMTLPAARAGRGRGTTQPGTRPATGM